ncbi:MAG: hypothetical protein ABJF11_15290 [Reichenbachiella sp.]|uniref:hypothetical protein n=1 Tax=Reichenbachiella sp. TaxID=2184521 RepID=UPI003266EC22
MAGIGVTLFVSAFKPIEINPSEDEVFEMNELLGLMVVPRVLWLSSAISVLAVLFYYMDLRNDGYLRIASIGIMAIGTAFVVLIISLLSATKHMRSTIPVVTRAIIVLSLILIFNSCSDSAQEEPQGSREKTGLVGFWKSYSHMNTSCHNPFRNRDEHGSIDTWFDFKESGEVEYGWRDDVYQWNDWSVDDQYLKITLTGPNTTDQVYSYWFIEEDGVQYLTLQHDINGGCRMINKYSIEGWKNWEF